MASLRIFTIMTCIILNNYQRVMGVKTLQKLSGYGCPITNI